MRIAIDYDNTFTLDPELWLNFMGAARINGHEVFIATFRDERYDTTPLLRLVEANGYKIYYTRGVAKKWWLEQFGPGKVDVWIDDNPLAILENSVLTVDQLNEWRAAELEDLKTSGKAA